MDKRIKIINILTRLAAISESIQESNPNASKLIDETLQSISDDFSTDEESDGFNTDLFPPIEPPIVK
mgnify:CR=1 FL=1